MTDDQRRVRRDSDELLEAVRSLRDAEKRKWQANVSSPEFKALADEVEQQAIDVWKLASRERSDGQRVSSSSQAVDDVAPGGEAGAAPVDDRQRQADEPGAAETGPEAEADALGAGTVSDPTEAPQPSPAALHEGAP